MTLLSLVILFVLFCLLLGTILALGTSQLRSILAGAQLVTTPRDVYPLILQLTDLKSSERFLELGSGLGHVTAFVADHTTAAATGIDAVPLWVILAHILHRRSQATFKVGSCYTADFSTVDVVYCYLLPPMLARLEPTFAAELRPGSRVISYGFPLPNRQPNRVIERTPDHGPLYLYRY